MYFVSATSIVTVLHDHNYVIGELVCETGNKLQAHLTRVHA